MFQDQSEKLSTPLTKIFIGISERISDREGPTATAEGFTEMMSGLSAQSDGGGHLISGSSAALEAVSFYCLDI